MTRNLGKKKIFNLSLFIVKEATDQRKEWHD